VCLGGVFVVGFVFFGFNEAGCDFSGLAVIAVGLQPKGGEEQAVQR